MKDFRQLRTEAMLSLDKGMRNELNSILKFIDGLVSDKNLSDEDVGKILRKELKKDIVSALKRLRSK